MNEIGPGSRLGPFEIVALLGRGGMGAVFRARDAAGREVALKILPRDHAHDRRFVERFRREGAAAARIRHPHITQCHGTGEDGGMLYLALELVKGGSLADRLKAGALPWRDAARFGAEIAGALVALHAAGIIHRDLKPANVLVDEEGRAKLTDFGLARDRNAERLTRTGELLGTMEFMAPEMAEGGASVTERADLYCLGATVHCLVTGRPPFAGSGPELVMKHMRAPPPAVSFIVAGTPPELDRVLLRLLSKKPEERGTAEEAAQDLDAIARGESARPSSPAKLYVGAALLGVAAIVTSLLLRRPPAPTIDVPVAHVDSKKGPPGTQAEAPLPAWFLALPADKRPALPLPGRLRIDAKHPGEYVNGIPGDDSVLVFVPAVTFRMGWPDEEESVDPQASRDALPVHDVKLSAYFIGKFEVSNAQFGRYVAARAVTTAGESEGKGYLNFGQPEEHEQTGATWRRPRGAEAALDDNPVVQITWQEAKDYAAWANLRLPTEAEWECAAAWDGRVSHPRPWGDDIEKESELANKKDFVREGALESVRSRPGGKSFVGAFNMCGNAREWVLDAYTRYPAASEAPLVDPCPEGDAGPRIVRGGACVDTAMTLSTHHRSTARTTRDDVTGFRIAVSAGRPQ